MAEGKYKVSQKGEDGGVPGTLSGMPGLRAKKQKGRLRDLSVMGWWYQCSDGKVISPARRPFRYHRAISGSSDGILVNK